MKKHIDSIQVFMVMLLLLLAECQNADKQINSIILDTDMGNDIDDALALAIMNRYIDEGRTQVLAIGMSKEGKAAAEYTDIVQTWYGHPNIPIALVSGNTGPKTTEKHYSDRVCEMKNDTGTPLFARTVSDVTQLPMATTLYRKVLASQPDHSVTFVTIGFSTNMATLLDTPADEFSPLTGKELVAKKVKQLVMMAGNMVEPKGEFNVYMDIAAARKTFAEWPTPIIVSPFELGERVKFPHERVNDIDAKRPNPVAEGYVNYLGDDYDACSWDPTALIYAVEGDGFFTLSPTGTIDVDTLGITRFTPAPDGQHRYLIISDAQVDALTQHLVEMITE